MRRSIDFPDEPLFFYDITTTTRWTFNISIVCYVKDGYVTIKLCSAIMERAAYSKVMVKK